MIKLKLKHLKKKSIVNVYNGNFLGYIKDVEISLPSGNISSLTIKLPLFKKKNNLSRSKICIVLWENIVSIGKDVILVNIIEN